MGTFSIALQEMADTGLWYRNPQSFKDYLKQHSIPERDTAQSISVDSIGRLDAELRAEGVMVFRLGSYNGIKGTQFVLSKSNTSDFTDYFFIDEQLFGNSKPELFIPSVSYQTLFGFTLLPSFTETSLINLAVFSGLLGHALDLDKSAIQSAPATGQSTFTFDVRPRATDDLKWLHNKGQVEVDAVFSGQRNSRPVAIIVESKSSGRLDSLAKHKILYPYLALRQTLPSYMETILVYLRAIKKHDGFHFFIAECEPSVDNLSIEALCVAKTRHLVLKM